MPYALFIPIGSLHKNKMSLHHLKTLANWTKIFMGSFLHHLTTFPLSSLNDFEFFLKSEKNAPPYYASPSSGDETPIFFKISSTIAQKQ